MNIQQARAAVNALEFGTVAWEAAMQVVRDLVAAEQDASPKLSQTSIDGDIWSV